MKSKKQNYRFEFMFRINGNPICAREFDIRNFNEDSLNSIELKEMMDRLMSYNKNSFGECGIIPKFLKDLSVDNLWDYYNPYRVQTPNDINKKDIFENEDIFTLQFNVDKVTVVESSFSGAFLQPKVKYRIDIKDIVSDIMSEIRYSLTQDEYTVDFNGQELKYEIPA